MKKLIITVLFVGFVCTGIAQKNKGAGNVFISGTAIRSDVEYGILLPDLNSGKVCSSWDTTILYKGDIACHHNWAIQKESFSIFSCLALHDAAGCPDKWQNHNMICTKCLRHFNIRESRWVEKEKDEYSEALERLNKIQNPPDSCTYKAFEWHTYFSRVLRNSTLKTKHKIGLQIRKH